MNLATLLAKCAEEGRPIRVGMIGAGKFGTMSLPRPSGKGVSMLSGIVIGMSLDILCVGGKDVIKFILEGGLFLFGIVFAVNSSIHSFPIIAYSDSDKVVLKRWVLLRGQCPWPIGWNATFRSGFSILWSLSLPFRFDD